MAGALKYKIGVGGFINRQSVFIPDYEHFNGNRSIAASEYLNSFQLEDCEVYTSCEPCPMCLGAIYWARPKVIYFANNREDAAEAGFDDSMLYDEMKCSISERKIPITSLGRAEAIKVFEAWKLNTEKVEY